MLRNRDLGRGPTSPMGPLAGVKVLDLSRFISGPLCATLLAEMGAEIIKVERPGGEDSRHLGPSVNGMSLYTLNYNRNKRAVTLNTRSARGRELLEKLVGWADVIVENYRPGTMEAMGLGYERLREIKPEIILTSVSGFGQTGPYRERALFDFLAQAMSGLMSMNGRPDDEPLLTGVFIADTVAAVYAAFGTVVAMYERQTSGKGQVVDVALLDSIFSCLGAAVPAFLMAGIVPKRSGNRDPFAAPATVFETRDGASLLIAAGTDPLFARLAGVMDAGHLCSDPRFVSITARVDHVDEIEAVVGQWVRARDAEDAYETLATAGIPCGIVADITSAVANPQLKARGMLVETDHPQVGRVVQPGVTVKLSRTPGVIDMPPALIGEHNKEIYSGLLGIPEADLAALYQEGAI
jgi:crotonobetainyl-CoA:carnitine CoA-transferase CaiB-like acyl-CoA transferase